MVELCRGGRPDNASLPVVECMVRAAGGGTIRVTLGVEDGARKVARVAVE